MRLTAGAGDGDGYSPTESPHATITDSVMFQKNLELEVHAAALPLEVPFRAPPLVVLSIQDFSDIRFSPKRRESRSVQPP